MNSFHPVRVLSYQKVEFVSLSLQTLMIQMLVLWLDLSSLKNLNAKAKRQFAGNLKVEFDQKVAASIAIAVVLLGNPLDFAACQMVFVRQESTTATQKYFNWEPVVTVQKVVMIANQGILMCLIIP